MNMSEYVSCSDVIFGGNLVRLSDVVKNLGMYVNGGWMYVRRRQLLLYRFQKTSRDH
jgi:hypothetical protein